MKKLLISMLSVVVIATSCTSGSNQAEKSKQDSIAESAIADSMLRAAFDSSSTKTKPSAPIINDSTNVDSAK